MQGPNAEYSSLTRSLPRRTFAAIVAALVCTAPAAAQERGTMELGAFASAASFDQSLSLKSGYGIGGRAAMFLDPRWGLEFEMAEIRATRPAGFEAVNVGILAGRLMAVPIKIGGFSVLSGAGAGVSTQTYFLHSYGMDLLIGGKYALGRNAALRVDGVWDWLSNADWKTYKTVRVGLSFFRHPPERATIAKVPESLPPQRKSGVIVSADSMSANEARQLRDSVAALRALRDSLKNVPVTALAPTALLATMRAEISFAADKSVLTDTAKTLLDQIVLILRANPRITVRVLGLANIVHADDSTMALGARQAQAAKDYFVARGIAANRVLVETKGNRLPSPVEIEAGGGRIFWLLIASETARKG
jgi:outer membrane protein OmpA-like peptidoglycan-associated protein